MGRKRVNEIKAGGKTTLYIPQDIDSKVLEFLQGQRNLSKALIELAYMHVYNVQPRTFNSLAQVDDKPEPKAGSEVKKKAEAMRIILNTDKLG